MKPLKTHHIGVIAKDRAMAEHIMDMFQLEIDYEGHIDAYDSDLIFTKYGPAGDAPIEFIIPHSGVLTKYRDGKGGLHHIAWEVEDVVAAAKEYEAKGMEMLESIPVDASCNITVNFLRPKYSDGVLFEFVQVNGEPDRK